MQRQPLIKPGWLRALAFLISFVLVMLMLVRFQNLLVILLQLNIGNANSGDSGMQVSYLFFMLFISSLASLLTVFIFRRFVDRQSVVSLGLNYKSYAAHAAAGFFLGLLLLGIGTFILIATGYLHWIDLLFAPAPLLLSLGMMLIIAFTEELVFRGYVLNNLMQSMNKWIALAISALVFTAFHSGNPGIHPVALINLFFGGLLLGVNYIYTRNLWFAICFHFCWNFYQGSVLGYKVSGLQLESIFQNELSGSTLVTGGSFGFEGSIFSGIICFIATALLAWVYEAKRKKEILTAVELPVTSGKDSDIR